MSYFGILLSIKKVEIQIARIIRSTTRTFEMAKLHFFRNRKAFLLKIFQKPYILVQKGQF